MNYLHYIRNLVTPVLQKGNFEAGILTPEQFVEAGDFLVYKCPTWEWKSGISKKMKKYLPNERQYLVTRNVPCVTRCSTTNVSTKQDGEWAVFAQEEDEDEIIEKEITNTIPHPLSVGSIIKDDVKDDNVKEEYNVSLDEEDIEFEDPAAIYDGVLHTRTYNIYITYDNYYRTPRVWLFGYDEYGNPLAQTQMFEDISPEHAQRTVTYETHPHEKFMALSVHPCKHANVMKRLISQSKDTIIRPDQYLCVFLKFIGTVIPTVQYDFSLTI